jgi:dienelactone hydrolase
MMPQKLKSILIILLFLATGLAGESRVGFRLIDARDHSRYYPADITGDPATRSLRIYLWYPAIESGGDALQIKDYLRMAADDFSDGSDVPAPLLPVQLEKGIRPERLESLLAQKTMAVRGIAAGNGPLPLIVLGQGLYYESPFSQYFLSEYLASRGYVVASCPLSGTLDRLVNRTVEDLETEVRDMEFVLGYALGLPYVDNDEIGVMGYDLGGMAGLLMCMRHPEVRAFFSLDSGIAFDHGLGIPFSHPNYQESRYVIPWMHLTQDRFVQYFRNQQKQDSLISRKQYGSTYLGRVPTDNHGCFTSYALLGLDNPVPGYWGPVSGNMENLYREMCRLAGLFFDGILKNDRQSLYQLNSFTETAGKPGNAIILEFKPGKTPPPSRASLIRAIVTRGLERVRPEIENELKMYAAGELFDENELNWLGYHFLYWWGRENEAVEVFRFLVRLFPESANAFDSLGEAYLRTGKTELAIENYKISLKLNPDNQNAKEILKELEKQR